MPSTYFIRRRGVAESDEEAAEEPGEVSAFVRVQTGQHRRLALQVPLEELVDEEASSFEAMKLMLPVEADRGGRVVEVLCGNGEPVEYGQALIVIDVS